MEIVGSNAPGGEDDLLEIEDADEEKKEAEYAPYQPKKSRSRAKQSPQMVRRPPTVSIPKKRSHRTLCRIVERNDEGDSEAEGIIACSDDEAENMSIRSMLNSSEHFPPGLLLPPDDDDQNYSKFSLPRVHPKAYHQMIAHTSDHKMSTCARYLRYINKNKEVYVSPEAANSHFTKTAKYLINDMNDFKKHILAPLNHPSIRGDMDDFEYIAKPTDKYLKVACNKCTKFQVWYHSMRPGAPKELYFANSEGSTSLTFNYFCEKNKGENLKITKFDGW